MTPDYKLPFWMAGSRATAVAKAAKRWWDTVSRWLRTAYDFNDAQTVAMPIVDLLAYQRGIERYRGEPEWLYRLRVHHAYRNWIDAGTRAGMERIFTRLQMPVYGLEERVPGYDWDMIRLKASLADYLSHSDVLQIVLQAYRRTCRRWLVEIQSPTVTANDAPTLAALTYYEPEGTDYVVRNTDAPLIAGMTYWEFA